MPHFSSSGSPAPLYREVTQAAQLGLLVNIGLGIAKLLGAVFGNSFALLADAINSLGDVVTTLVVLFAIRVAQRPPDAEHPYGHSRAEGIAAANVALLVILSAMGVGWEALQRIREVHEIPPTWTLWIAGTNVVIKESLYRYKIRVGRRTGSSAIIANAWDHRSDAFCALAVFVGLTTILIGGPKYIWADELASLVIVGAITWSGVDLLLKSSSELMDVQADPEFVQQIRQAALSTPGVQAVEKLWVRKSGMEYFVDIHIQVDGHLTVSEGHRIGHTVKDQLVRKFPPLRDALVHLEPYPHQHDPASALAPENLSPNGNS